MLRFVFLHDAFTMATSSIDFSRIHNSKEISIKLFSPHPPLSTFLAVVCGI